MFYNNSDHCTKLLVALGNVHEHNYILYTDDYTRFFRHRHYESPSHQQMVLLEKKPVVSDLQQQPLPPIPPSSDSGHCSLETDPLATPTTSTMGRHPVTHHQRTIRINGNEYAHIWESPLPHPKGRPNRNSPEFQPTCRLEIVKDPSGKNTFYTCTRYSPHHVHGKHTTTPQFDGCHHHLCPERQTLERGSPGPSRSGIGYLPPLSPRATTSNNDKQFNFPSYGSVRHQPEGGVTCGVVRHVPAELADTGPRYSTLERKPGFGYKSSSSSV